MTVAFAIRVENLVKRYGDFTAVNGISFDLKVGECVGLLGPNGAGKTSTIEILEGLKTGDQVILSDMSAWDGYDRIRLQ